MRRTCLAVCGTVLVTLGVAVGAAQGASDVQGEQAQVADLDAREGRVAPSARQRRLAAAHDLDVTWSRFGSPASVSVADAFVARGLPDDPETAARRWIARNRALLGLGAAAARDLELVSSASLGAGRAVLLRQRFDGLPAGRDGLISIGVNDGRIAYVSSSLAPDTDVSGTRRLGPEAAVRSAGEDAGMRVGALSDRRARRG